MPSSGHIFVKLPGGRQCKRLCLKYLKVIMKGPWDNFINSPDKGILPYIFYPYIF
jgi:hypothetical protein